VPHAILPALPFSALIPHLVRAFNVLLVAAGPKRAALFSSRVPDNSRPVVNHSSAIRTSARGAADAHHKAELEPNATTPPRGDAQIENNRSHQDSDAASKSTARVASEFDPKAFLLGSEASAVFKEMNAEAANAVTGASKDAANTAAEMATIVEDTKTVKSDRDVSAENASAEIKLLTLELWIQNFKRAGLCATAAAFISALYMVRLISIVNNVASSFTTANFLFVLSH
jgi:hypothetical protein